MIGLFNECFPPVMDGVSMTVSNLAKNLHEQGHDLCVVTPDEPGLQPSKYPFMVCPYFSLPVPMRHPYRYGLISHAGDMASRTLVRSWADISEEVADRYMHLIARKQRKIG